MTTSNDDSIKEAIQLGLKAKRNNYKELHWKALTVLAQKVLQLEAKLHTPVGQHLELCEGMTVVLEKQEDGPLKDLECVTILKVGETGRTVRVAAAITNLAAMFGSLTVKHVDADELRRLVKDYYYEKEIED